MPALDSPGRRAHCEAIGRLLVGQSGDLLSHSIAMGRRLGWSAEELARLTAAKDALQATVLHPMPATPAELEQLYRCDAVGRKVEHIGRVGQFGELALARQMQRGLVR